MDQVREHVFKLGDINQLLYEKYLTEEERAKKEVEQSYIILSIYKDRTNKYDDSLEIPLTTYRSRIVIIDILIGEALMFIR